MGSRSDVWCRCVSTWSSCRQILDRSHKSYPVSRARSWRRYSILRYYSTAYLDINVGQRRSCGVVWRISSDDKRANRKGDRLQILANKEDLYFAYMQVYAREKQNKHEIISDIAF
jgi:hypothetical protein